MILLSILHLVYGMAPRGGSMGMSNRKFNSGPPPVCLQNFFLYYPTFQHPGSEIGAFDLLDRTEPIGPLIIVVHGTKNLVQGFLVAKGFCDLQKPLAQGHPKFPL